MSCDVCGKVGEELIELKKEYKTEDIHHACLDCIRVIEDYLTGLRVATDNRFSARVKKFMLNMKAKT